MSSAQDLQHQVSEEGYQKTLLYGGAITTELPISFADASTIRQIPDNQEVFLHQTQLSSIVFDLLERAGPPAHPCTSDEAALLYHYQDITATGHVREGTESDEESKIWENWKVTIPHLGPDIPAYSLLATQRPKEAVPAQDGKPSVDFTGILLTLVRLEAQKTDLLVTVNVPHARGEYNPQALDFSAQNVGTLLAAGKKHQERLLGSLKIEDWSLFGQE